MGIRFLTAGESHGPCILAILEGMPAGLFITQEIIDFDLKRRQTGFGSGKRMEIEKDTVRILSGVMDKKTNGAPIGLFIENRDHQSWKGRNIQPYTVPRPGHADLNGAVKYGFTDLRPVLERASARETAARVAVGAICRQFLAQFQIQVGGYICSIGEVSAELSDIPIAERFDKASHSDIRCPDESAAQAMRSRIQRAMQEGETLGGVIEVIATGLPQGLGSHVHWDRRLDAQIGAAVLGIQAIKGVEIGLAFENTRVTGTQAQDPICLEGDMLIRPTNRCGGLEGGMTTGQPLVVRAAMKPIATTIKSQPSVNLANGETVPINYERSDSTPVIRAVSIVEAMLAFVLANSLLEKLGGDSMDEVTARYKMLRCANLEQLKMIPAEHFWWPAS